MYISSNLWNTVFYNHLEIIFYLTERRSSVSDIMICSIRYSFSSYNLWVIVRFYFYQKTCDFKYKDVCAILPLYVDAVEKSTAHNTNDYTLKTIWLRRHCR